MSRPSTDTEDRLFDEALTLFSTRGFAGTSVRQIIEAVGLSKPVLYYYFDNKLDLFTKTVERTHRAAYRELENQTQSPESPARALHEIMRQTFLFCKQDWRVPRMMFSTAFGIPNAGVDEVMEQYRDRRYQKIKALVRQAIDQGEFRETDLDATTIAFCSLMDYPCSLFTREPESTPLLTPALADSQFEIFLKGVAP